MKYNYMLQYFDELPKSIEEATCDAKLMLENNEELQNLSDRLFIAELNLLKHLENNPEGLELFKEYKKCFENHAGESCAEMYVQGLLDHQRLMVRHQLVSSEIFKYTEQKK